MRLMKLMKLLCCCFPTTKEETDTLREHELYLSPLHSANELSPSQIARYEYSFASSDIRMRY